MSAYSSWKHNYDTDIYVVIQSQNTMIVFDIVRTQALIVGYTQHQWSFSESKDLHSKKSWYMTIDCKRMFTWYILHFIFHTRSSCTVDLLLGVHINETGGGLDTSTPNLLSQSE